MFALLFEKYFINGMFFLIIKDYRSKFKKTITYDI